MYFDETIGAPVEAPAKVLKLSEAIRVGARMRPQSRAFTFANGASCAIGAAYEGLTGKTDWPPGMSIYEYLTNYFQVPFRLIRDDIPDRNDSGESRESIADWLESQGL